MKKTVLFFVLMSLVLSCSKEGNNNDRVIEITINLSNSETYEYVLGQFEENDITEIVSQASHYTISEIVITQNLGFSIYKYKPQTGFVGEDYVELSSEKLINEETNEIEARTIKLTFKVIE